MRMLCGLSRPSSGTATIAGREPADDPSFLRDIAYLAQEVPLYPRWTADDHLSFGAHMNESFDEAAARDRLRNLGIPFDRRIEKLSGGMRAQVALAVAIAKRPRVLLLDEPVAALDPLARREFLASLTAAVADGGLTVLLSSHLVTDLERVCDHLVLLTAGHCVLCDDIEAILATHKVLSAARRDTSSVERQHTVLTTNRTTREVSLTVRLDGPLLDPDWRVDDLDLEGVVLAYMGRGASPTSTAPLEAVQ
jgi:ABC-2 type transport system ATP-binding protein